MGWLVPLDQPPLVMARWLITLPAGYDWSSALKGAIVPLTQSVNWSWRDGGIHPKIVAEHFREGLAFMREYQPMIGAIVPYATVNPPPNVLPCEGGVFTRFDYPDLYAALDPVYIVDADHFTVPDMRGRYMVGVGRADPAGKWWMIGEEDGSEFVTLGEDNMPRHTHTADPHSHTTPPHTHDYFPPVMDVDLEDVGVPQVGAASISALPSPTSPASPTTNAATVTIGYTGNDEPFPVRPPSAALRFGIVYG